jgi:glycosyltransferase involved in cell wall biosynthesis
MDCSVIIATYNRARLLRQTLASLGTQVLPAGLDWEIVVVDNNSKDETRQIVDSFARQSGIPVRYVFEGRQGKSFALNSALPVSRGRILAFTDDDITPRHDWLQATLGVIHSRELDGVGGKVLPRWEVEPPRWLRQRPHLLVWLAMLDNEERRLLDYPITNQCRLVGANMAFNRALFDELGDFNTSLGHHGKRLYGTEETELIHRFLKGGKRIGYDPDIVVYHHVGRERLTKRFFLKRVFYQAVADAVMTDAGAPFVWRAERWRYRHLAGSFASVLARTVARRGDAFECQLDVSKELGTLWARTMRLRPPQIIAG